MLSRRVGLSADLGRVFEGDTVCRRPEHEGRKVCGCRDLLSGDDTGTFEGCRLEVTPLSTHYILQYRQQTYRNHMTDLGRAIIANLGPSRCFGIYRHRSIQSTALSVFSSSDPSGKYLTSSMSCRPLSSGGQEATTCCVRQLDRLCSVCRLWTCLFDVVSVVDDLSRTGLVSSVDVSFAVTHILTSPILLSALPPVRASQNL